MYIFVHALNEIGDTGRTDTGSLNVMQNEMTFYAKMLCTNSLNVAAATKPWQSIW